MDSQRAPITSRPNLKRRMKLGLAVFITLLLPGLLISLAVTGELKAKKIPDIFLYCSPLFLLDFYLMNLAMTRYSIDASGVHRSSLVRTKTIQWAEIHTIYHWTYDLSERAADEAEFLFVCPQ
jgi:hypothetical protein